MCNQPEDGCFEMSVGNPDKGVMPLEEVRKRVQQFIEADVPLVVTHVSSARFPWVPESEQLFSKSCKYMSLDIKPHLATPP